MWVARRGLARLAALACMLLVAGCAGEDVGSGGKIRIRLSGYTGNPVETDLVSALVAEFNRSQSGVEVVYEPVPGQYYPKILTMLVAGTAPDVFYLDIAYFQPFLAKKILRPLDVYLARSTVRAEQFLPALWAAFTDDGHVYGIPKDFNTLALFYNKDMFDGRNVPYPDATWDLDTFRVVARRLTEAPDGRQYGFVLTHDDIDRYLPIARMFGARLFDAAGRCVIDSPQARQAMDYYAGLSLVDQTAIYPSEVGITKTYDVFGRGLAAMVFEGSWLIPYLRQFFPGVRYGTAGLPAGPVGHSNFLFTVAYVIPHTSRQPDAAWALIEFLTSETVQERITFAVPSRRTASERYVRTHPEYRPILDAAAYAQPYEFGPKSDRVRERLGLMVQEVFLRAKSVQRALADAARDIDQINQL
jgi:multiple sugar transport system substrate-binding protein